MSTDDRFKQSVIATLAKRAANRCANPDCGAVTSGPTSEPNGSVNVGEAAHIYGAHPGSARYDEKMASSDRSAITNAIWLCGNCHKKIDDSPSRYPPGLLFEWQREHEKQISEQIGKTAAEVRHRYEKRHLEEFGRLSYLAERLIIEKDAYWEYLLTAEVLRFEIAPTAQRWDALKRGLYTRSIQRIDREDSFSWLSDKSQEILLIVAAFSNLTNFELARTWGEPGIAGSDVDIVSACRLYGEVCSNTLLWEESVRFTRVDDDFSEVRDLFIGVAGEIIEQTAKIPKLLTEIITPNPTSGAYNLELTIELPAEWEKRVAAAMKRAERALHR
ncbi:MULTISPECIES: HNH endonuclease [unclassified Pseudomonas]|uniref:HNH endonuclease n=1 Tax=unclassified Pseudomonas TaxID=196821 RepID=UPI000CD087E7|nr:MULTISPECIES: HNH endonuclease [unclassified Pseudomonas]POA33365.1 HNH endonuclease [Pseudomonas sp. GW456-R21]POA61219.1 HNH endonuclease [Pseudomonas sp. GW460-R15]